MLCHMKYSCLLALLLMCCIPVLQETDFKRVVEEGSCHFCKFLSVLTFWIRFSWKPTNCSLQLWVCSFALLGCRILAKCSFFSAIMLVFFKWQCFTLIAWIIWRIHWFELKNPTGTTEVGVGTYLLPLNMSLYIFSDKKLCHKSFTAGSSSCRSNCSRNCKTVVSIFYCSLYS